MFVKINKNDDAASACDFVHNWQLTSCDMMITCENNVDDAYESFYMTLLPCVETWNTAKANTHLHHLQTY